MSMSTFEISEFYINRLDYYDRTIPSLFRVSTEDDDMIPFLHTVNNKFDICRVERCQNLVYSEEIIKEMFSSSYIMLRANTICMQFFEVKRMLESGKEFTEMLKDSVENFVVYNSISKYNTIKKSNYNFVPIGNFD
mmetsp:Transcript_35441/g.40984  ORF Transcript_35441/g.40984 Transcript_35441/m.40984 type:complete len:136 (+) Transcript_35441:484-891(+)